MSPYGQILNSDLYCQQLDRLNLAIRQKWPELVNRRGVVFHQDNPCDTGRCPVGTFHFQLEKQRSCKGATGPQ
ncbi:hypothetical protein TNCV_2142831 [Trichonephila clavipes]|nr:hypothetical protein TNCV_2142831 [Trichonephila clavipes]